MLKKLLQTQLKNQLYMAALSPPIFDTLIEITSKLDFSSSFNGKKNPLLGLVGTWEGLPIPVILWGSWKSIWSFSTNHTGLEEAHWCCPRLYLPVHILQLLPSWRTVRSGLLLLNTNVYHQVLLLPGRWSRRWGPAHFWAPLTVLLFVLSHSHENYILEWE